MGFTIQAANFQDRTTIVSVKLSSTEKNKIGKGGSREGSEELLYRP